MNKAADPKPELKISGALPLSPAPETLPVTIRERYGHYVEGELVPGRDESLFPTINPANGQVLAQVAAADAAEVDAAVRSARAAYEQVWSKMPPAERGKYLYRIARRI